MSTLTRKRLFVYGTLRVGGSQEHRMSGARHIRSATTSASYKLLSLGWYPALFVGGNSAVYGDVFEVPKTMWAELDEYEDCPGLYRCEPIELNDGSLVFAYIYNGTTPAESTPVSSGDWLAYEAAQ